MSSTTKYPWFSGLLFMGKNPRPIHAQRRIVDSYIRRGVGDCGQATIEAAFLIPVIFLLLLLLLEPSILLYDRMVMSAAAADGCRLIATSTGADGVSDAQLKDAILRHLGSVPQQDLFHVHGGNCSWDIQLAGDETSQYVSVSIKTKVKPLPVVDFGSTLLGLTDGDGYLTQRVHVEMRAKDAWVMANRMGASPSAWVKGREWHDN